MQVLVLGHLFSVRLMTFVIHEKNAQYLHQTTRESQVA